MATYDIGDRIYLQATFRDTDETVTDPTTIVCEVKPPAGAAVETYTYGVSAGFTRVSTGIYKLPIDLDTAGRWYYRFEGTGALVAAEESSFDVSASHFS